MVKAPCDRADILETANSEAALSAKMASWQLERFDKLLLVECAPCQGFAAHRKSFVEHDPRRNLFKAFCRIAAVVQPNAILMENVPDLFSAGHWPHFAAGHERLVQSGFEVRAGIYNLAGYGLPQERFRSVVMAFRDPFVLPAAPPHPGQYRTVRETIGHLLRLASGEQDPSDLCIWYQRIAQARSIFFGRYLEMAAIDQEALGLLVSTALGQLTVAAPMFMDDFHGTSRRLQ